MSWHHELREENWPHGPLYERQKDTGIKVSWAPLDSVRRTELLLGDHTAEVWISYQARVYQTGDIYKTMKGVYYICTAGVSRDDSTPHPSYNDSK